MSAAAAGPAEGPEGELDWRELLFRRRYLGVRLDLEPTRRVLAELCPGVLERPPFEVVQIVGTNGKGSTAAMLAHGLTTLAGAGPVGLFTSPHLERVGERIRVDGVALDDAHIREGVERLARVEGAIGVELSFFEVLTAIAVEHFVARGCTHVVLEAGLGARLDSTTAIPAGRVGIARIALDHQAYLGDTLSAIAAEKAAAIRSSAPVFSVDQDPRARAVLDAVAREHGAPLRYVDPCPRAPRALVGEHQRHNAALALALLHSMGVPAQLESLDDTRWPGRLERLSIGGGELLLDVAHNLAAIDALSDAVEALELRPDCIVFGTMADKAGAQMSARLGALAPLWLVPPAGERSFDLRTLPGLDGCRRFDGPSDPRLSSALADALAGGQRVLVCGSHALVGPLRSQILQTRADDARLRDPVARG